MVKKKNEKKWILTIRPALQPKDRHVIQNTLEKMGYNVTGGGTHTDGSQCDISFTKILQG